MRRERIVQGQVLPPKAHPGIELFFQPENLLVSKGRAFGLPLLF